MNPTSSTSNGSSKRTLGIVIVVIIVLIAGGVAAAMWFTRAQEESPVPTIDSSTIQNPGPSMYQSDGSSSSQGAKGEANGRPPIPGRDGAQ